MPASIGPCLGLSYGWTPRNGGTPGESGWGAAVTDNFKKIDALLGLSVLGVVTVPAVTTNGTRYLVAATGATGVFAGQANKVAARVANAWEFYTPVRGLLAENQATGSIVKFNGAAWVDAVPTAGATLHASNPGSWTLVNGAAFTKIQLYTQVENGLSGWSTTAWTFTPAESGMYLVEALVRPVRTGTNPMGANVNLRLGFGSAAADSVDVVGDTSTDLLPFTVQFCKPMRLTAGTAYFLFGNHSSATAIAFTHAELKITRLGP